MKHFPQSFSDLPRADQTQIKAHGLSSTDVQKQLALFQKGKTFISLLRPCSLGDGVHQIPKEEVDSLLTLHNNAASEGRMMKFVPASGAGTRMFQPLKQFLLDKKMTEDVQVFLDQLPQFPFFPALEKIFEKKNISLQKSLDQKKYSSLVQALLSDAGLNYAQLPKGLIPFHRYGNAVRTAFEEHLEMGKRYLQDSSGNCRIHFVVSPSYLEKIKELLGRTLKGITFSIQEPSTDNLALESSGAFHRDQEGKLVFRPGGHGALLNNLHSLQADILFIQNIDNIPHESLFEKRVFYKKLLGGYLLLFQGRIFDYLFQLEKENLSDEQIEGILRWIGKHLGIPVPEGWDVWEKSKKQKILFSKLHRPLRVCGVVPTKGDVGGAPFWICEEGGKESKQLVEWAQIDEASHEQMKIFRSSSYFNSVDLVGAVRDHRGDSYDLKKFADPTSAILTKKFQHGAWLEVLEWPGLWNGGMSFWNTVFVEVPALTFTPVKSFLDLLRPEHRPIFS